MEMMTGNKGVGLVASNWSSVSIVLVGVFTCRMTSYASIDAWLRHGHVRQSHKHGVAYFMFGIDLGIRQG